MLFNNKISKYSITFIASVFVTFNTGCISRLGNALATQKQAHTNAQAKITNHTYGPNDNLLAPIPDMELAVDSGVNSFIRADKIYASSPLLRSTLYIENLTYSRDPATNQKMIAEQTRAAGEADANAGQTYVDLADTVGAKILSAYGMAQQTKQREIESDQKVDLAKIVADIEKAKLESEGSEFLHEEQYVEKSATILPKK